MPQNDGDETGVKAILALWEHCADERNAAVAELIEAAEAALYNSDYITHTHAWESIHRRLDAALAAIKGGDDE